jgi:glycosyltransferase involved in cell wall biosynthesis
MIPMKIAILTPAFPPVTGGVSQSMGNFYQTYLKVKNHPPYLVFTTAEGVDKGKEFSRNVVRVDRNSYRMTFRVVKYFLGFVRDALKVVLVKERHRGRKYILNQLAWFGNVKNYLRALSGCYYADRLLQGRISPDIVMVAYIRYMGIVGYLLSKYLKVPLVIICHGDDIIIHNLEHIVALDRAAGFITRSKAIEDVVRERYSMKGKHYKKVWDGVIEKFYHIAEDKATLREHLNIPPNEFAILDIGRLCPRKNFDSPIIALAMLARKGIFTDERPAHLYIIGVGEELEYLENLVRKLKLEGSVTFLGGLDDVNRNKFLKASDLFVMTPYDMPDSIEGFGIVYIESNFFGVPVIGTISGGVVESVEDGVSGFLLPQRDPKALAQKIQLFYEDEDLLQRMGMQGQERVQTKYAWEPILERYLSLFDEILKDHRAGKKFNRGGNP